MCLAIQIVSAKLSFSSNLSFLVVKMMCSTSSDMNPSDSTEPVDDSIDNLNDHEYVIKGLNYWLNNKPKESEIFFKRRSDRTSVLAGYSFVLCMNGVISYEIDKIDEAQKALKLLEKRCTTRTLTTSSGSEQQQMLDLQSGFNWLSNVRYRIFGNVTGINMQETSNEPFKSTAQILEEQIILGDTYMSMAILTFLTQDFAGLMKGSWLLRKAWKIYQKTYKQLYEMYIKRFGYNCDHNPPMPLNYTPHERYNLPTSFSYFNWTSFSNKTENNVNESNNEQTDYFEPSDQNPSKTALKLDLNHHEYGFNSIKTCPTHSSNESNPLYVVPNDSVIDTNTLKHLMAASSFGYGLFQLTTSLLPAKLLKIISIFGFEGNRDIGVSCLTYARSSSDMRATLATLALLWFYTFGTQLFLNEDGYAREKIEAANGLLDDCHEQYQSSAIFLFFRGRLERMKADAQAATEYFRKSFRLSAQNELKLLCLHEIAWCALIQLDFVNAMSLFNEIRQVSVYSKAFYTYMTAICQGSIGKYENLMIFRNEITDLVNRPVQKQNHIVKFVQSRVLKFNDLNDKTFWRFLVYEMMFLWSTFSNIRPDHLKLIVEDCTKDHSDSMEPMVGLKELILGGAHGALKNYSQAIDAYTQCIAKRTDIINQDMHISAFAHYELATLLIHCHKNDAQLFQEAKNLLQKAQKFQNYDLENRLCVQIQQELKKF